MKVGGSKSRMSVLWEIRVSSFRISWRKSWSRKRWRWGPNTNRNCQISCWKFRKSRLTMRESSERRRNRLANINKMRRSWSTNCKTWGVSGRGKSRAEATWSKSSTRSRRRKRCSSSHRPPWQRILTFWPTRPCLTWSSSCRRASSRVTNWEKKCSFLNRPWTSKFRLLKRSTSTYSV